MAPGDSDAGASESLAPYTRALNAAQFGDEVDALELTTYSADSTRARTHERGGRTFASLAESLELRGQPSSATQPPHRLYPLGYRCRCRTACFTIRYACPVLWSMDDRSVRFAA
jgi:hypothetical protein